MDELTRAYIYHIAMVVLSAVAAILNFGTVCAILFNKILRKRQNIFTFNLALADCVSSLALFVSNVYTFTGMPFEKELRWIIPIFTVSLLLSILSTLAIAFERLIILRFDTLGHHRIVTAKRSIAICVIGWIILPSTYLLVDNIDEDASMVLLYVISPCVILASLLFTSLCYALIYNRIAAISADVMLNDLALRRRAEKTKKALVTFALVVATTTSCWVLMCSILLVDVFVDDVHEAVWFQVLDDLASPLVCVNAILNPFIVWLRLTQFRALLNACCGGRLLCQRVDEPLNPSSEQSKDTTLTKQCVSMINLGFDMTNVETSSREEVNMPSHLTEPY